MVCLEANEVSDLRGLLAEEAFKKKVVTFQVIKGELFIGSIRSFETRVSYEDSSSLVKKTVENQTAIPRATCRGWVSIVNLLTCYFLTL